MTRRIDELRAGVVGTGFIGVVHVDALRRLGVEVAGVVGSTPERAAAKRTSAPGVRELRGDARRRAVDVVHLTTPNHLHYPQVKQALAAGKHVVCEKPLAMTPTRRPSCSSSRASGLVHCTNFNIRFYPGPGGAGGGSRAGELGDVWNVHGGYLQDWLLLPTDWNWRLEPEQGGDLRAVGDIGSHWLDLAQFVTGRGSRRCRRPRTTSPSRRRPVGGSRRSPRRDVERETRDDDRGRRAHPAPLRGRRARLVRRLAGQRGAEEPLRFEVDGADGSLAWDAERHEELWLGHRDAPNETLLRNPARSRRRRATRFPPATPRASPTRSGSSTARSTARSPRAGPRADYPTFRDGTGRTCSATPFAARTDGRWVEVAP